MDMTFAADILSAVTENECRELAKLARGHIVIELGSHFGRSTIALASAARMVHAVDWHMGDPHAGQGDSASLFLANLSRYGMRKKVVAHIGRFDDVLPLLSESVFDMAFIDAFHEKEAVERDLNSVFRILKPRGVIAFHDYGRINFGVTEVVDSFAAAHNIPVQVTEHLAVVTLQ